MTDLLSCKHWLVRSYLGPQFGAQFENFTKIEQYYSYIDNVLQTEVRLDPDIRAIHAFIDLPVGHPGCLI